MPTHFDATPDLHDTVAEFDFDLERLRALATDVLSLDISTPHDCIGPSTACGSIGNGLRTKGIPLGTKTDTGIARSKSVIATRGIGAPRGQRPMPQAEDLLPSESLYPGITPAPPKLAVARKSDPLIATGAFKPDQLGRYRA